jgi:hypothetical protein
MGRGGTHQRPRRGVVGLALVAICATAVLQTFLHLDLALGAHRFGTIFDLDRSNGVPDLVSTLTLTAACAGAALLALRESGVRRPTAGALACLLGLLTLADALHDGAHPTRPYGVLVVAISIAAVVLLFRVARNAPWVPRVLIAASFLALAVAFVVPALDRYDQRFERERGDPVREYQIVVKEGLELVGWSLVALALWLEAGRRGPVRTFATGRASQAPAAPTRRAA